MCVWLATGSKVGIDVLISGDMSTTDVADETTSELSIAVMEDDACSEIVGTSEDVMAVDGIAEVVEMLINGLVEISMMVEAVLAPPRLLVGSVSPAASSDEAGDTAVLDAESMSVETAEVTILAETLAEKAVGLERESVGVVEGINSLKVGSGVVCNSEDET